MINRKLDSHLCALNRRYQDLYYSRNSSKLARLQNHLKLLLTLDIKRIINQWLYSKYAHSHFSTNANKAENRITVQDVSNLKIAVYSCIVGDYDIPIEPILKEPGVDYFMFTDQTIAKDSSWVKIDITKMREYGKLTSAMLNRKLKIMQNEMLLKYDYTIYIDGTIEIVAGVTPIIEKMASYGLGLHFHYGRDCIYDEAVAVKYLKRLVGGNMDEQLGTYREEGFPTHYGLYENSIIVRDNRNKETIKLMHDWWEEYNKNPTRDQLSLPYVIWKTNFDREKIFILGNNLSRNVRFNRISDHK